MLILGLTGSIGMGKSTTAAFFKQAGVPVHDADAAVHRLYEGAAVRAIEAEFPGVAVDGRIDRALLSERVLGDEAALKRLETLVHPMAAAERQRFIDDCARQGARMVFLDIPLLFETGSAQDMDAVVVVTAPAEIQRERVLARPGMSAARFEAVLAKQWPDARKRANAHFIIHTERGLAAAQRQTRDVLAAVAGMQGKRL